MSDKMFSIRLTTVDARVPHDEYDEVPTTRLIDILTMFEQHAPASIQYFSTDDHIQMHIFENAVSVNIQRAFDDVFNYIYFFDDSTFEDLACDVLNFDHAGKYRYTLTVIGDNVTIDAFEPIMPYVSPLADLNVIADDDDDYDPEADYNYSWIDDDLADD